MKYKGKKLDQFKTTWFRKQHSSVSVSIVKVVAYDNISLSLKTVYVKLPYIVFTVTLLNKIIIMNNVFSTIQLVVYYHAAF